MISSRLHNTRAWHISLAFESNIISILPEGGGGEREKGRKGGRGGETRKRVGELREKKIKRREVLDSKYTLKYFSMNNNNSRTHINFLHFSLLIFKVGNIRSSLVDEQPGYLALSLLWCGFDPWLGNFRMPLTWPKFFKN